MQTKTTIGVKLKVAGFHFWKDAPDQVKFLRDNHRHIFGIECTFEVNHDDRDKEFFIEQSTILAFLKSSFESSPHGFQFKGRSCEMIAKTLLIRFPEMIKCRVDEDNENYAEVERVWVNE